MKEKGKVSAMLMNSSVLVNVGSHLCLSKANLKRKSSGLVRMVTAPLQFHSGKIMWKWRWTRCMSPFWSATTLSWISKWQWLLRLFGLVPQGRVCSSPVQSSVHSLYLTLLASEPSKTFYVYVSSLFLWGLRFCNASFHNYSWLGIES